MTAAPPRLTAGTPFTIWRDPAIYASFPSLIQTDRGLLMACRAAPREPHDFTAGPGHQQHLHPRSTLMLGLLDDDLTTGGLTAGALTPFPIDLMSADQDPNLTRLPDGALLMSSFCWRPKATNHDTDAAPGMIYEKTSGVSALFWGGFTARSTDEGRTWGPRIYLPPLPGYPDVAPGRGWPGGRHRGQVVATGDGRLLLGSYDRVDHTQPFSSVLHESTDMGRSWQFAGPLAKDPGGHIGFVEPTLYTLAGGDILALHRSFGAQDRLAITRSTDDGRTWGAFALHDVIGHPYHVVTVSDDWALVVYARRAKVSSIHARLMDRHSGDLADDELALHSGAQTRDIGYPTALRRTDGTVLVSYYWVDDTGTRHIAGVTIDVA